MVEAFSEVEAVEIVGSWPGRSPTPTAYANPDGETAAITAGITEVTCALTWNRFGQGTVTASPQ